MLTLLLLDNVFGHVLTAVISLLGGSIAFGDEINEDNSIDISSCLSQFTKAKPTIIAR
jgi:hypothetical protein